ncbi:nucleoside-diphosphate sugar epimerase/dehydratase [Melaminivora sp.]|uniref:polysaccharide biosynthesis protein n=1 Tax=Melaminivora sp. TaxID=1933032 RepID=UPI0028B25B48|nr:nucleoside-diphosphate sugar epimerase/dehydratase [Melaminivora sp.]
MMRPVSRTSVAQGLLHLPRMGKRLLAVAVDTALCALTVWLAWCLRLEEWLPLSLIHPWAVGGAVLLGLPVFVHFGLYAAVFRYAGWNAMLALGQATATYGLLYMLVFTIVGVPGVPRSVGILQPLLMFIALGLSRVGVRLWLGDLYRELLRKSRAPGVMVYGAGAAGRQLAAGVLRIGDQRLVAYIDDNPALQGRRLDGIPVHGPDDLAPLVDRHRVRQVLLAIPSATTARRKQIVEQLRPLPVHVRTLPGLADLVSRGVSVGDLQELDIEDLLGRDPVQPDHALMAGHLGGKTVLVTGAGGSIGSELCRQVLQWRPARLLLLESSEYALYEIHRELQAQADRLAAEGAPTTEVVPLLGSVQDAPRVDEILSAWQPHILYHAAAYKHVPLVEFNVADGLRNNVWGTLTCARAAARHGVGHFVLVSTDKAVRPTNVMGASKRLAEMVLQALAAAGQGPRTCFTMVRFGNVLGSSGSVVPLFRRQIEAGGPITLTHPDITRYFMTIPEAAQLVVQAGAMAQGGDVFVLDMGESVRIHDLACRMVELTGQRVRSAEAPWGTIDIQITGLRPGEKLYEELLIDDNTSPTGHPRILKASERFLPWGELEPALRLLEQQMQTHSHALVRASLLQLVEGYRPGGDLVDHAHRARQAALAAREGAGAELLSA